MDPVKVYGESIFERGRQYFNDGRVTRVIKFKNNLIGEVMGTDRYRVEVNLDNLRCRCSCPYSTNCKHGAAVLLQYNSGDCIDGDGIEKRLKNMDRDELIGIIEKLVHLDPSNLIYLDMYQVGEKKPNKERTEALDKEVFSRMQALLHSYQSVEDAEELAKFIKVYEHVLTKKQIFYMLEFLVRNCEDYGWFYDDYSDSYFGDMVFENLWDALYIQELEEGDFKRIRELQRDDNYQMLEPFFNQIVMSRDTTKLAYFEDFFSELLDEPSYVQFLINCGLMDKARMLIKEGTSINDESRFKFYLLIDKDEAIEFALEKGFYSSLLQHYHDSDAHDKTVDLFYKVVKDSDKKGLLNCDLYIFTDIFDSIMKDKIKDHVDETLYSLFQLCYSCGYYGLCVDIGIEINDVEVMQKMIPLEVDRFNYTIESKMKLLKYLEDEYEEEVEKELMKFTKFLIEKKDNYTYEKAAECVFLLLRIMGRDEWDEYVKGLYLGHFRKTNLWSEFAKRGLHLKKKGNVVTLSSRG